MMMISIMNVHHLHKLRTIKMCLPSLLASDNADLRLHQLRVEGHQTLRCHQVLVLDVMMRTTRRRIPQRPRASRKIELCDALHQSIYADSKIFVLRRVPLKQTLRSTDILLTVL